MSSGLKPAAFVMPAGYSGCAWWRLRLPIRKLSKVGSRLDWIVSDAGNKSFKLGDIERFVNRAEIICLQAPGNRDAVELINFYKLKGKKVVVEYDDYSFDLSPANPRYAELGTRECEMVGPDGKYVYRWRNGENGFDLGSNIAKYEGFVQCVKAADMVTVTTDYLASKFRPHNPNVRILPNSVDFDLWKPIPRPKELEGQIRLGWFGGDSHFSDLWLFRDVLPKILAKYPNVRIVIQAPQLPIWAEMFKDIPRERLEWYPWADLSLYTLFLAARHIDIGLCPLDPESEFNRCKSGIKMFEFAALKTPSICQDMPPYSIVVDEEKTGMLASRPEEWGEKISRLVEDANLRRRLGENAYSEVNTRWNLETNCRLWDEAYLSLLEPKNECPPGRASISDRQGCGVGP